MLDLIMRIVLALFNAISTILITQYFFSSFSEKRNNRFGLVWVSFIIILLSLLFIPNSPLNLIVLIISNFFISFTYKFNTTSKILFTLVLVVLNGLVETLVGIVMTSLLKIDELTLYNNGKFTIYGALLCKIVVFIICLVINSVKNKTLIGKFRNNWISIFVLPVSTIIVAYALYLCTYYYDNELVSVLSIIGLVLLIIGNLLIVRTINHIHDGTISEMKLKTAEEFIKQQEKQYDILFKSNESIVKFRHDYKNFLIGIASILSQKGEEKNHELKRIVETELESIEATSKDIICGNSVIDTIMRYKMGEAQAKGISIDFNYKNAHKILVSGIDMAVLLGNSLDNAIEATERLKNDNKTIEVNISSLSEQVVITIINDVLENVNINNMESTKGDMHGYGIVNIKSIVSRYNGNIDFFCENKKFTTIIILNVK